MATTTMTATAPGAAAKACEVCGNSYEHTFDLIKDGQTHTFDSFECAIHKLAPRCEHCRCAVVGHGVETGGKVFCCAHCARNMGVQGVADRV
ncbi:MAG: hypothetical protein U0441_17150 [Polyangiaceae bacterium]